MLSEVPSLFLMGVPSMNCNHSRTIGSTLPLRPIGIQEKVLWVVDQAVGKVNVSHCCLLFLLWRNVDWDVGGVDLLVPRRTGGIFELFKRRGVWCNLCNCVLNPPEL